MEMNLKPMLIIMVRTIKTMIKVMLLSRKKLKNININVLDERNVNTR